MDKLKSWLDMPMNLLLVRIPLWVKLTTASLVAIGFYMIVTDARDFESYVWIVKAVMITFMWLYGVAIAFISSDKEMIEEIEDKHKWRGY